MTKRFLVLLLLIIISCSLAAESLRILHTNDSHAAYEPSSDGIGGYTALEYHLTQSRSEVEHSLWLDAGDMLTGTIFSSLEYENLVGGAVLETFSRLGIDAATYGNHEFDISYAHAKALTERADFPFYSANLLNADGSSFGDGKYGIFEMGAVSVGVIGLTIQSLPDRVKAENVQDIEILPYAEALDAILDEVDEATDLIVLLTHNGFDQDQELARALDDRVDLIIGGHSHLATTKPVVENGIYILSSGSHLRFLGQIDLEVEDDRISSISSQLIALSQPPEDFQSEIADFLIENISDMERQLSKVSGILPFDFEVDKYSVTKGSDWVAKALLSEYPSAQLAMINNGGLRKHLPAGPITLRDLHEYIPFGNTVTLFSCTGEDILTAQAKNLQIARDRPYDILTVSSPDWLGDGGIFRINGENIHPDQVYRVVTHDYVVSQWDKYLGFEPQDIEETGDLFLDVIIRVVEREFSPQN
nr:5-nucleotidase / UDP-sugar diphosphatase [Candidatus Cloacimonadota bacterium]